MIETIESETISIRIYIAGNYDDAISICRVFCEDGFCVSVQKSDFVYKYGMESGVVVNIINYPRFPESEESLMKKARVLAGSLMVGMSQGSYSIQSGNNTLFFSRKND